MALVDESFNYFLTFDARLFCVDFFINLRDADHRSLLFGIVM
jgi:hypothetical protein